MGLLLSPWYGHVILVSDYPVVTAVNWSLNLQYHFEGVPLIRKWEISTKVSRTHNRQTHFCSYGAPLARRAPLWWFQPPEKLTLLRASPEGASKQGFRQFPMLLAISQPLGTCFFRDLSRKISQSIATSPTHTLKSQDETNNCVELPSKILIEKTWQWNPIKLKDARGWMAEYECWLLSILERSWDEEQNEYKIFSILSIARGWNCVILAGKRVAVFILVQVLARMS